MAALPPLSVTLAGLHRWLGPSPAVYVHAAQALEDAGVHQVVLPEHVVMGPNTQHYPYGAFPYPPEDPWVDPLTLLAAIAAATTDLRLGTGVLIAPLRPAVVLAKQIATLDALSGGRVDLGVGVGWQREEYDAAGVPFERRWSRMDDQMRACRALWSGSPASFASDTVAFDGIWCEPRPTQPRLPLWVGAKATEAAGRRIADWGDGWLPIGDPDPFALLATGGPITDAWAEAGRDPAELGIRVPLPLVRHDDGRIDRAAAQDTAGRLAEAGATCLSVTLRPHDLGLDGAAADMQVLVKALSP
jgi:probable F420-dependent oxidoreductase